ncbi:MAG TPA: hypothetical protein VHE79_14810 [Spirochaetia bacterium]
MNDIVPREKLTKQALQGVVALAGGIGSFVVAAAVAHPVVGIIIGGAMTVFGLAFAGSKHERTAGVITTIVGAATLVASIPFLGLGGFVHGLAIGAGIILVGVGAYSLIKFFRGLKSRS